MKLIFQLVPLLALAQHIRAHGVLTAVTGTNGVTGQGFGVIASTPRDGSTPNPFEQDTSVIRNRDIASGATGVCGKTRAGGNNDVSTQLDAAVSSGLPSAAADGTVSMTLHQVNGDGAGPYTCEVSTDATGASFAAMTVTTNVPGRNSLSTAKATDFPLVAQLPAGTTCTGGANGDACLVRCRNSAIAGPFGGCAAITTAGSANATATNTTADASATEAAAAAAAAASTETASSVDVSADAASLTATDSAAAIATSVASSDTGATSESAEGSESDVPSAEDATSTATSTKSKAKSVAAKLGLRRSRLARTTESEDESDDPIHEAQLALADLERRFAERVRRSRIFGRQAF